MIPPKYKFYIGQANIGVYYANNRGISDSGEAVLALAKYSSGQIILKSGKALYINLISLDSYNAIFFYDNSRNFISFTTLVNVNGQIIIPPSNAAYYALRFNSEDANFMAIKDTNFIYTISVVNPHYSGLNKKYAKENGQEFFRASLDGKINLFGSDYDVVKNSGIESQMIFMIYRLDSKSNKESLYYKGEFNKTDCTLDYGKRLCELSTKALDSYTNIMNKYENTYDLIKLAPEITKINMYKRALTQVYVKGADSISNFFGGTYWESDVNEAIDSHSELINKYFFAYVKAGNEFYVSGAKVTDANGVYAGVNGTWYQEAGYAARLVKTISIGDKWNESRPMVYAIHSSASRYANMVGYGYFNEDLYKLRIIKESTGAIIYESEKLFYITEAEISADNNIYVDRYDIKMVNVSNSSDSFVLDNVFVYHIYRRLLCDVDSVDDSGTIKDTYPLPPDDFVSDNRNYKRCIGVSDGLFYCTSRVVDTPTRYGLNDYGKYFTNKFIPLTEGANRPLPISRNSWANASLWYVYAPDSALFEDKLKKQYTLKDSYSIAAVIKVLLEKIDPAIRHEATAEYSRFLYDTNTPIFMDRFYVYITQKTNILKGDYDQAAQKAETTLKQIMEMLRDCFKCYWYIEDNKFKIEHISFFINGGSYSNTAGIQLDFTKLTDMFNKKRTSYFQTEIEYDKNDLSQRYEFNWMDDATEPFGNFTIDINSNYVQKDKTEEINVDNFSSDVDYMLFNPSGFSNDGFALLCPINKNGTLELPIIELSLIDESGREYDVVAQNWYASWPYLIQFYMYDMPARSISSNKLKELSVNDIKASMTHNIEFPSDNDLDELKLIKTAIGDGKIDEISVNIDTRLTKVKLLYRPE